MRKQSPYLIRNDSGATAVEFAFILPLFIAITFGIFETGRLFFIKENLEYSLDEGSRYALINSTASNSAIETEIRSNILGITPSTPTITIQTVTVSGRAYKQVSISYTFTSPVALIAGYQSVPLSAQTMIPVL